MKLHNTSNFKIKIFTIYTKMILMMAIRQNTTCTSEDNVSQMHFRTNCIFLPYLKCMPNNQSIKIDGSNHFNSNFYQNMSSSDIIQLFILPPSEKGSRFFFPVGLKHIYIVENITYKFVENAEYITNIMYILHGLKFVLKTP